MLFNQADLAEAPFIIEGTEVFPMDSFTSFEAGTDPWPEGFLLYPPNLPAVHSEGDPMTARDPLTGNLWIGAIQFNFPRSIYVARLGPSATEFNPSVEVDTLGNMDKGWMAPIQRFPVSGSRARHGTSYVVSECRRSDRP